MPSDWKKNGGGAPHGMATGVRTALRRAGFKAVMVRKNFQYNGFIVNGTAQSPFAFVSWRPSDDMTDEQAAVERQAWLKDYADALELSGYVVKHDGSSLTVSKPGRVWTEVPHKVTGEVVGWITKGQFRAVENGRPNGEIRSPHAG